MEKFKVGDWVQITKSDKNWNNDMDKFDGKLVQLTYAGRNGNGDGIKFKNTFGNGYNIDWNWVYAWGHFIKVEQPIIEPTYEIY